MVSLHDFAGAPALVVAFLCNHCPYVQHLRRALAEFDARYRDRGLRLIGINANDATRYPADAPDKMAAEAKAAGWQFPYLFDPSQAVAKAYRASCTPDFFLFDTHRQLVYRGQFDSSRPGNGKPANGSDLGAAVEAVLGGQPVSPAQVPSIGCNIKWKPGNEPDYFR
jgi:thiol-disulfide isomerase/thioredoxin